MDTEDFIAIAYLSWAPIGMSMPVSNVNENKPWFSFSLLLSVPATFHVLNAVILVIQVVNYDSVYKYWKSQQNHL
jgi:hypothetical protein